jgi:hypothetical protein
MRTQPMQRPWEYAQEAEGTRMIQQACKMLAYAAQVHCHLIEEEQDPAAAGVWCLPRSPLPAQQVPPLKGLQGSLYRGAQADCLWWGRCGWSGP